MQKYIRIDKEFGITIIDRISFESENSLESKCAIKDILFERLVKSKFEEEDLRFLYFNVPRHLLLERRVFSAKDTRSPADLEN